MQALPPGQLVCLCYLARRFALFYRRILTDTATVTGYGRGHGHGIFIAYSGFILAMYPKSPENEKPIPTWGQPQRIERIKRNPLAPPEDSTKITISTEKPMAENRPPYAWNAL